MRPIALFVTIILSMTCCGTATAAKIFVPGDHPTIQVAIDAAVDGDVVVLYDGTYTGEGNKDLVFYGKAITVRSKDGADGCIIDCEGNGRGFIFNEPPEAKVMEITYNVIENCHADGYGGGISCTNSNGSISNNLIGGNEAYYGGGISCDVNAQPLISGNIISGNSAYGNGGILCKDWAAPELRDNVIEGNDAETAGGARVACADLDGDGRDELIVSGGADPASGPTVRVFHLTALGVAEVDEYDAFPAGWTHGVSSAAGTF